MQHRLAALQQRRALRSCSRCQKNVWLVGRGDAIVQKNKKKLQYIIIGMKGIRIILYIYILYSSAMAIDRAMQCCGKQLTYIARSSTTNEAGF